MTELLNLPDGYYELPKGKLANVVTCLEMLAKPPAKDTSLPSGFSLRRFSSADLATFRALFKAIGPMKNWRGYWIIPRLNLTHSAKMKSPLAC
jgi:hypothetical protein